MTLKQRLLRAFYPALLWLNQKVGSKGTIMFNTGKVAPLSSFYHLSFVDINGNKRDCSSFKVTNILLVNTASDCGYTAQLGELQQLQNSYQNSLIVVGFPSNDFKQQEQGSNDAIATFCKKNYGVNFLLAEKVTVKTGPQQSSIFHWLSHNQLNGWCNQPPQWNFSKYFIDETGQLCGYFGPGISPANSNITACLQPQPH